MANKASAIPRGDYRQAGAVRCCDPLEAAHDAPDRAEETDERRGGAEGRRKGQTQLGDSALQIAQFEPDSLIGRERQTRVALLQFDAIALARRLAGEADILVV